MTLEETLKQIKPLNEEKMKTARRRWIAAFIIHAQDEVELLVKIYNTDVGKTHVEKNVYSEKGMLG